MKSKAFPIVALLGTGLMVFAGCVIQNRPADSTPAATPAATTAPAAATTTTPATTATTTAAPTATTTTAAPSPKVLSKPKAQAIDAGAPDGS
ncbi:MAG: hypothetical protein U0263_33555 [Polyangiaceae bacterium]